jgi:hypothetical protein
MPGTIMGPGQAGAKKSYEMGNNYNFPIVALKALTEHQPRNYQFNLDDRALLMSQRCQRA